MAIYIRGNDVPNAEYYNLYWKTNDGAQDVYTSLASSNNLNFNLTNLKSRLELKDGDMRREFVVKAFALDYEASNYSNVVAVDFSGEETPVTPTTYTFTINPTPTSATVTLSATGYSTVSGTGSKSITVANGTKVNWSVSADGYTAQNGTWIANGSNETKNIVLVTSETPVNLWKYSSSDMDAIMKNARYRLASGLPYKEEGDDFDKTYGSTEKIYVNGNNGTYTLDLQSGKTYRWQFIPYYEYGFLKLHNPWGGPAQTTMNGKRVFFYRADDSLIENDAKCLDETGMLVTVPQDAVYMRFMAWGYLSNTNNVKPRYDTLMITEGETEYSEYIPYQS